MLPRKPRQQVAAICYRTHDTGKEVLVSTSRDTGRWIVPKGWPIKGKDGAQAALRKPAFRLSLPVRLARGLRVQVRRL